MRTFLIISLSLFCTLNLTVPGDCGLHREGPVVTISVDERIEENLVITARIADISGVVDGDLIFAGEELIIDGDIYDNLYAACRTITVTGDIGSDVLAFAHTITLRGGVIGDFRGGCQSLTIDCDIAGDVMAGAQIVRIGPNANIHGDLYVGAQELIIEGRVRGKVLAGLETLTISGTVYGDVDATFENLHTYPGAEIRGDLTYRREGELETDLSGLVGGEVRFREYVPSPTLCSKWMIWGWIFAISLVTAIILVALLPSRTRNEIEKFFGNPGNPLLVGLIALFAMPMAALVGILLLVTLPIGLVIGVVWKFSLYFGWVYAGILAGYWILGRLGQSRPSLYVAALLGVPLMMLLAMIPYLNLVVILAAVITGMGLVLTCIHRAFTS